MKRGYYTGLTDEEKKRISGHRDRLKKRFLTQDTDYMDDSRILELLLTYAIPRIDVYPIAVNLLIKFGDLDGIFAASVDELCSVQGIGENTAVLLKLLPTINRNCALSRNKRRTFKSEEKIAEEMCKYFHGLHEERTLIALFDSSMQLIKTEFVSTGSPTECAVDLRTIAGMIIRNDVAKVAIAHNHPNGDITPSFTDMKTMSEIKRFMNDLRTEIIEMYIVHGNNYFRISEASALAHTVHGKLDPATALLYNSFDSEEEYELVEAVIKNTKQEK